MKGRVEGGPGEQARGRDRLYLLPPPGPFSTGKPQWGLPTLTHTYLCLVPWPRGWHREYPKPMGSEPGGGSELLPDPSPGSEKGRRRG